MAWREVFKGRWERPIDNLEGYFVLVGKLSAELAKGREQYTLFSKIKIDIDVPNVESSLRHAWKQIRFEQPQIATKIEDMTKIYEVPDSQALEQWLSATFIVSSASDGEELYHNIKPTKQSTMYYLPRSSELVLRCHHYNVDGMGMVYFWNSYFSALASPIEDKNLMFGSEPTRLNPVLEDALGFTGLSQDAQEKGAALFNS